MTPQCGVSLFASYIFGLKSGLLFRGTTGDVEKSAQTSAMTKTHQTLKNQQQNVPRNPNLPPDQRNGKTQSRFMYHESQLRAINTRKPTWEYGNGQQLLGPGGRLWLIPLPQIQTIIRRIHYATAERSDLETTGIKRLQTQEHAYTTAQT